MSLTTAQIADYYKLTDGPAKAYVKLMLLESLGPQQRRAYEIVEDSGLCFASEVAAQMGIKINHAGNLMKALVEYGLVERIPMTNPEGLFYRYEVVE